MREGSIYLKRRILFAVLFTVFITVSVAGIKSCSRRFFGYLKKPKLKIIKGHLKPDQVLYSSLIENQIEPEAANELLTVLQGVLDLTSLQVKDEYKVYLDKNKQIVKFIYKKSPVDLYFAVRKKDGKFNAFRPAIYLGKKMESKEFTIKTSLFAAVQEKGEEDALVFAFVDIFAWDIDFFLYPRVGDKIKIYFEKYYKKGKFVKYGRIYAAQYKGRDTFNAVYFTPKNNREGYYSLEGKPVEKMFLKSPLKFTGRITSYFGGRRDPFTSRHSRHRGVDFKSYYGAPIVATSDGQIIFTGWKGAYGRLVIIRHSNGYSTYYGHTSRILARRGSSVKQGQVIAKVGSTGRSTGPHVHYEIRLRNRAFNPLKFNQPKRKPLKGKDLKEFKTYAKVIWKNI